MSHTAELLDAIEGGNIDAVCRVTDLLDGPEFDKAHTVRPGCGGPGVRVVGPLLSVLSCLARVAPSRRTGACR